MEHLGNNPVKNVSQDLANEGHNSLHLFCNGEQNWTLIGSNFNHQIVEVKFIEYCRL